MKFFKQKNKFMTVYVMICLFFAYISVLAKSVIVEIRREYAY